MPMFSPASEIYCAEEIRFLRSCYLHINDKVDQKDRSAGDYVLAKYLLWLYRQGLRDQQKLETLALRIFEKNIAIK